MPSLRRSWLLVALLAACGKTSKPNEQLLAARASASAKPAQGSVAPLPAAAAPSTGAAAGGPQLGLACDKVTAVDAARRLMNDWNAALNAHDSARLEKLYAPQVSFYGRDFSREQVTAAKRAALAASPAFKQRLSDIRISPADAGASATFSKVSGGGKPVQSSLVVSCADGAVFAISSESDVPSDALAQAHEGCEAAMYGVAFSLPAVTKEMAYATDDARAGGLSYPTEGKHYSAAIGFHHDDHFELAFFLDWNNGTFTINQGDLPVPPAGLARVKAACPK